MTQIETQLLDVCTHLRIAPLGTISLACAMNTSLLAELHLPVGDLLMHRTKCKSTARNLFPREGSWLHLGDELPFPVTRWAAVHTATLNTVHDDQRTIVTPRCIDLSCPGRSCVLSCERWKLANNAMMLARWFRH